MSTRRRWARITPFLAAHGILHLRAVVAALRHYVAAIPEPGQEPVTES